MRRRDHCSSARRLAGLLCQLPTEEREMKTRRIGGARVLQPTTENELREALNSGQPFQAPEALARRFGLPEDPHVVGGVDVGVLDPEEARG